MITVRRMDSSEIARIGEVDRSEHVTQGYVLRNGALELEDVEWQVPPWFTDGRPEHSIQAKIARWRPILEDGGVMFGALDGDKLVGFAICRPNLSENTAELAVLHVSNGYRRQGIGTALKNKVIRLARADGAKRLYVSAAPSRPTVDFYSEQGFHVADEVNQGLCELEPEDIHMIRHLSEEPA